MGTDEITGRKPEDTHEGVGGLVEGGGRRRGEEGSEESEGWVRVKEMDDLWKEEDGGERGEEKRAKGWMKCWMLFYDQFQ